jgi:hypothetical protein
MIIKRDPLSSAFSVLKMVLNPFTTENTEGMHTEITEKYLQNRAPHSVHSVLHSSVASVVKMTKSSFEGLHSKTHPSAVRHFPLQSQETLSLTEQNSG